MLEQAKRVRSAPFVALNATPLDLKSSSSVLRPLTHTTGDRWWRVKLTQGLPLSSKNEWLGRTLPPTHPVPGDGPAFCSTANSPACPPHTPRTVGQTNASWRSSWETYSRLICRFLTFASPTCHIRFHPLLFSRSSSIAPCFGTRHPRPAQEVVVLATFCCPFVRILPLWSRVYWVAAD